MPSQEFLNKTLTFQFRCLLPVEAIEPCSALSVLRCWITMGLVCGWTKSKLIEKSCCDLNLRFLLRGRDFIKGNLPFTLHKAPGISTILINIERLGCCLLSPGQGWSAASGGLSPLATAAAHSSSRSRSSQDGTGANVMVLAPDNLIPTIWGENVIWRSCGVEDIGKHGTWGHGFIHTC